MSTVNGKGGLLPVAHLNSMAWNHRVRAYPIASAYNTSIYKGDIIVPSGGNATRGTFNFTAGQALGVAVGFSYTDPTSKQLLFTPRWPANTVASDALVYVCDDPDTIFLVQGDAALTAAALGKNIDLAQTTAGSDTTGLSGMNASSTSIAVTATLRFRVVGLKTDPDNGWTDTFPKILVIFNGASTAAVAFHFYRQATGL